MARMDSEEERELIEGHYNVVVARFDEWPDDQPVCAGAEDADVVAAYNYVTGYANALGMTALELLDAVGIGWDEPVKIDREEQRRIDLAHDLFDTGE